MTVLEVIQKSAEFLAKKNVDSPRLQVELMLAHVLKMPRMKLYLNFDRVLKDDELEILRDFVKRRGNREPLQHILGTTSFCGLEISVNPHVLIPRPETEILAERGWLFLRSLAATGVAEPRALDFGTGSGCLSVALAVNCVEAKICAVDISPEALKTAQENAAKNNVQERITFFESDGFSALPKSEKFHLIVSNPPYIPAEEIATLEPEVRDFDPKLALAGGADGLDFYRKLAGEASELLLPGGKLMAEFGDNQAQAIAGIFEKNGWKIEGIEKDYTQRERFIITTPRT